MTKRLPTLALVSAFALASTAPVRAQPPAPPTSKPAISETALKIQVLISRYQGDKKISSMPYSLSVTGGGGRAGDLAMTGPMFIGRANLRMGAKIPVAATTFAPPDKNVIQSFQYQDVGTNIDCEVWSTDDGRYRVQIAVDDSSVYPDDKEIPGGVKGNASFRSFRASDAMILKDGATAQFTTATDKVSGETVRVDVTLTVVK